MKYRNEIITNGSGFAFVAATVLRQPNIIQKFNLKNKCLALDRQAAMTQNRMLYAQLLCRIDADV